MAGAACILTLWIVLSWFSYTAQGLALPTEGRALLHQLTVKKPPPT